MSLKDSPMIPPPKRILTIDNIPLLKPHPPLKILRPRLVRCNLKRMPININCLLMNIIQILHLDVGLIHSKHLTPTPDKLIILAIGLDNVDKFVLFKGIGPLVV